MIWLHVYMGVCVYIHMYTYTSTPVYRCTYIPIHVSTYTSSKHSSTHVNPWLIHVNVWQKPLQYCKVIRLQLIKINKKKKKKNPNIKLEEFK